MKAVGRLGQRKDEIFFNLKSPVKQTKPEAGSRDLVIAAMTSQLVLSTVPTSYCHGMGQDLIHIHSKITVAPML